MLLESKDYYIDLINSTKANKFTSLYHYSGVGFKKAKINQGIYRKSDNLLVGVLQWGCSAQEGIRLDRYVKEPITKEQYLELNRFCMANSEGKNAESQAIALGIKWIKKNRPDIKLLVSYAGRKEGNYGYIYQATNWEYLGYFVSNGFWFLDGQERHQITVWYHYKKYGDTSKSFKQGVCDLYHDVRQTWTKQFIYIQRLDKMLTCATSILPYPKPDTEYPICTRVEVYKRDDEFLANYQEPPRQPVTYYYEKETWLFGKDIGANGRGQHKNIAIYDSNGDLETVTKTITEAAGYCDMCNASVSTALKSGKKSKEYFFRYVADGATPDETIEFDYLCEIDGVKFVKQIEIADYCGVSRQAVSGSVKRLSREINGRQISWNLIQQKVDFFEKI